VLAFAAYLAASASVSALEPPGRSDAPAVRASASSAGASDRRRTFVGVVGFAALVFGLAGLWLVRRSRRRARVEPEVAAAGPVSTEVKADPAISPASGAAMQCPTCREEYGLDARFCKLDGNRLVAVRTGTDARGPTGGICPVCGQGFDPGIPVCPAHGEELVPAPVYNAGRRISGSYPKICPTCGIQYPSGSGFCGADGSALVTIN
jgi:hypothetical protein